MTKQPQLIVIRRLTPAPVFSKPILLICLALACGAGTGAQAQDQVDVTGGFFSKDQINAPIADPAPAASGEKSTWQKQTVGKDTFAVEPPQQPLAQATPVLTAQPAPDPGLTQQDHSDDEAQESGGLPGNIQVDQSMADVLKAAKELSRKVEQRRVSPDGAVPSAEYYQKAIDAVDGAVKEQNVDKAKGQPPSHRF